MDPTTIGTWIGVLVAAGGVIGGVMKFVFWLIDEWQKRRPQAGFTAPRRTLQIAEKMEGNCWWGMGKRGDDPTMNVVGSMFITNISNVAVRIPQVELRCGFLGRKRVNGVVMVPLSRENNLHGFYDIPPNETRNAHFDFWVFPPVEKEGLPFKTHSVTFIDQFGNRHTVKNVVFTVHLSESSKRAPKEPEEFPYQIADPIEKEVVSVLKAELDRYGQCGRLVGGLGSVHIVYEGRPMTGVGSDSWTPDSPANQVICQIPGEATLKSDNLEALLAFYDGLDSVERKQRFVSVLLERLDQNKGYRSVSYFIVCVLLKIGHLSQALEKARRDLKVGDDKAFGFSNVMMLLNGLLKYRHPDFSNEMLDEIERAIHNVEEHPFLIPAKVSAIRARRLTRPTESTATPTA